MSNFDLKKYLAEGILFKEIKAKAAYTVPEGFNEIEDISYLNDDEDDPGEVLKAWTAPMEGWDYEHMDDIWIKKEYDYNPQTGEFEGEGKFYVDGYISFSDFDKKGPFDTFEEAFSIAVKEMEGLKEDWDDEDY